MLFRSVSNFDSLSDVAITSATNGQWLYFDGTNWINSNTLRSNTNLNTISRYVTGATTSFALEINRDKTDGAYANGDPVGIAMSVAGTGAGNSGRFVAYEGVYSSTLPGARIRVSTDNFSTATTAAQFFSGRAIFSGSIQPGTQGAGSPTAGDIIRDITTTNANGRPKYYDSGTSSYRFVGGAAPVYTRATKPATGAVGDMIAISDASGSCGSAVNGMIAFWDTTNNRWSYMKDNSAV